jgi:hypothetical protein
VQRKESMIYLGVKNPPDVFNRETYSWEVFIRNLKGEKKNSHFWIFKTYYWVPCYPMKASYHLYTNHFDDSAPLNLTHDMWLTRILIWIFKFRIVGFIIMNIPDYSLSPFSRHKLKYTKVLFLYANRRGTTVFSASQFTSQKKVFTRRTYLI